MLSFLIIMPYPTRSKHPLSHPLETSRLSPLRRCSHEQHMTRTALTASICTQLLEIGGCISWYFTPRLYHGTCGTLDHPPFQRHESASLTRFSTHFFRSFCVSPKPSLQSCVLSFFSPINRQPPISAPSPSRSVSLHAAWIKYAHLPRQPVWPEIEYPRLVHHGLAVPLPRRVVNHSRLRLQLYQGHWLVTVTLEIHGKENLSPAVLSSPSSHAWSRCRPRRRCSGLLQRHLAVVKLEQRPVPHVMSLSS
jgi:hypothetical protein